MISLPSPVPTNRYAKPCKLFQDGKCPLTPDRCEFAHVKISTRMCYDYARGVCAYGDNCRWSHSPLARKQAGLRYEKKKEQEQRERERALGIEQRDGPQSTLALPSYSHSTRVGHALPPLSPVFVPHPYHHLPYGQQQQQQQQQDAFPWPVPPAPAPSPASVVSSSTSTRDDHDLDFGALSPTASDAPSLSLSNASSDTESLSGGVEPISQDEGYNYSCGSPLDAYAHPPWWSPAPNVLMYSPTYAYNPYIPTSFGERGRFDRTVPYVGHKQRKADMYKTKPCKFFTRDGTCPKGDDCPFIHPYPHNKSRSPAPTIRTRTTRSNSTASVLSSSSASSGRSNRSSSGSGSGTGTSVPSRPLSRIEELHSRDFYPITWRVIGGGVMIGGQRRVCKAFMEGRCAMGEDCPERHPGSEKDLLPDLDTTSQKTARQRRGTEPCVRTVPAPASAPPVEEEREVEEPIQKMTAEDVSPLPPSPCRDRATVSPRVEAPQRARSAPPRLYGRPVFVARDQLFAAER